MDFKTLLPDFEAIKKTDWKTPQVNTKDTMSLVSLAGAALMVVFVFFAWLELSAKASFMGAELTAEGSRMGIATWYGFFAFLCGLAAVVGCLYQHVTLTFSAAVLGLVFGLIGFMSFPEVTVAAEGLSKSEVIKDAADWKKFTEYADSYTISRIGAVLYMIASAVTAVVAYLKITKK